MDVPAPQSPDELDATLKPPQFTLRTLWVAMTAVSVLLGLLTIVGSLWFLAILLFLVLVAAHVLGNSIGTQLRNGAGRPVRATVSGESPARRASRRQHALPAQLRERSRLPWPSMVMTAGGAFAASYFGGSALAASYPDAPLSAVVLAFFSSGVLGGIAGFAGGSFLSVVRQALREAHAGIDRPRACRRRPPG